MAKQIKLKDLIGEAKSYNLDIETEAEYSEIIDDFVTLKVDRRATVTSTASNITIAQFGKTDNTKALKKILKYADSNLDVNTIKNNFEASDDERSGNDQEQDIWKYTIDKKLDFHKAKKAGILKKAPITKMDNTISTSLIDMMAVYTSDANPLADTQWTSLEDFMKSAADYITGSDWKKFQKDVEERYPILENKINEMKGVKHYTKDGKEWTGATHKMPNGTLMTQDPHNKDSEELFHKEDLEEKRGLWDNVHAKRKRGEKPAKKGDDDYPDEEAWKDAQESVTNEHGGEAGMAKSDLFKISNYGQEIHDMLSGDENLPEWLEAKITKAADYLGSVKHYLEYEIKTGQTFESNLNEADKYETDNYKVGDTIELLKYNWKVIEADFKPGKSYKDSFTFVDNKQVAVKAPPTNKNAVGYKLEDGDDSAFYFVYKANSGKTITKLAVKGFNESVLNEGAINIFADEMNDEGVTADIFDAMGDGSKVNGQFTKKKWDDGVPVTKYLSRGGVKSIKTPNGKFQIIETKSFWYYEIDKGWAAISKIEYGTPPFEY